MCSACSSAASFLPWPGSRVGATFKGCASSHDLGFKLPSLYLVYILPLSTTKQRLQRSQGHKSQLQIWIFLVSSLFCSCFPAHISKWVLQPLSSMPAPSPDAVGIGAHVHSNSVLKEGRNGERQTQLCHHPLLLARISSSLTWALRLYYSAFVHDSILPASELVLLLSSE